MAPPSITHSKVWAVESWPGIPGGGATCFCLLTNQQAVIHLRRDDTSRAAGKVRIRSWNRNGSSSWTNQLTLCHGGDLAGFDGVIVYFGHSGNIVKRLTALCCYKINNSNYIRVSPVRRVYFQLSINGYVH